MVHYDLKIKGLLAKTLKLLRGTSEFDIISSALKIFSFKKIVLFYFNSNSAIWWCIASDEYCFYFDCSKNCNSSEKAAWLRVQGGPRFTEWLLHGGLRRLLQHQPEPDHPLKIRQIAARGDENPREVRHKSRPRNLTRGGTLWCNSRQHWYKQWSQEKHQQVG